MSRKKGDVWNNFDKKDNFFAICKYCKQTLSYKASTGNLNSHLRKSHPSMYLAQRTNSNQDTTDHAGNLSQQTTTVENVSLVPTPSTSNTVADCSGLSSPAQVSMGIETSHTRPRILQNSQYPNRSECRDKWKNLRAVFVRHMKAAPSGSAIKKKKPYYLSEAMQFTKPYIKTLTQSISENLPEISREEQDVSEVHEDDEYLGSLQQTPSQSQSSRQYEPERQSQHQKPPQQTESLPKTRFGSKRKRIMTEFDKSLLDYYKAKKAYLESHSGDGHGSDARKMFLLSLLPEINVMTDEQMRIFKRKVLYLIDKIMPTTSPTTYLPAPDIFMSSQTTTSSTPHV